MPREVAIPAQTIREEIRGIEEFPPSGNAPGMVRVMVGKVDAQGDWIVPQQMETFEITGEAYDQLLAGGEGWAAPGKPIGTYRNEDLWYFVDYMRSLPPTSSAETL